MPPGQYEARDFPVLSLGPTPDISAATWKLEVTGLVEEPLGYSLEDFLKLPFKNIKKDIHCVTKWSKLDTSWEGVSLGELMRRARVLESATHLIAHSYDGYSTNLPIEDVRGDRAFLAARYEGEDLEAVHGGPVRLLVPHLYFWKSAKWLKKLEFIDRDNPGFWEVRGYHNYGDPWREQRYSFDG